MHTFFLMVDGTTVQSISEPSGAQKVPCEDYVPDGQWEEERIMEERAAAPRTLDSATLRVPLSTLDLPEPKILLRSFAPIGEAVEAMQKGNFGAVLIVDSAGRLIGIFTERDVIRKIAGKGLDWKTSIEAYMTPEPETLGEDASLAFALNMMTIGGYRHVPLVGPDKKPLALVSIRDVVRYICSFFEKEVTNLPPRPNLLKPTQREDG